MQNEPEVHGSLNIPGTFEVRDRFGWVHSTSTSIAFKHAEAHAALLNGRDPDGGYDWFRVPYPDERPAHDQSAE
ncbi:hypothetical protein [Streptomyces sp. OK228]|uniref:hypothetical protein n=1 Tax=Streptomyces sp. OK228 TaxID=1882786 RepID=UPI000BCD47DC|nr:hypothetical protein [Streptomyces sp. OK228]SOE25702.1 hypothetical protein SAMN05442782_2447 [Streptomyces sp. OK228]